MCEAIKDYTLSRKIKRPSYSLVARWVKESWDAIDINMIRWSFKCCGVSNATDGTEDNLIFDFDRLESKISRKDPGREIEGERNENDTEDSDENDSNYNKSESEESDESESEESDESESGDSNESESEDNNESELEDSNKSESEENYYKENEEQTVFQDWS
jgi:hypothetical protein